MKKHFNKADLALIILLIGLAGYAWRLLPETVIRSDGLIYMLFSEQRGFWGGPYALASLLTGGHIFGNIFQKLFGPHISLYLWAEFIFILVIDVLFYVLVRVLTKSRIIAFSSALIFSTSHFGTWGMYGTHCYCFFLERATNMPWVIVSFIFLHLFLKSQKKKLYIIAIFLYFLGLGLGHFAILLTPGFVLYPFFWYFFSSKKRSLWQGVFFSVPFGLISLFFVAIQQINESGLAPPWTFFEFFSQPEKYNYFQAVANQFVYWAQYLQLLPHLFSSNPFGFLTKKYADDNFLYYAIIYIIISAILYKNLPKLRGLLFTSLGGTVIIFFLNTYLKLYEVNGPEANRYLYIPTYLLSIFWGIALWYFFLKRKGARFFAGIFLLIVFYFINVTLLNNKIHQTFDWNNSTKLIFEYIVKTRDGLAKDTMVVGPSLEFHYQEANFFTENLGRGEVVYLSDDTTSYDWTARMTEFKNVIRLTYDKSCNCVREVKIK